MAAVGQTGKEFGMSAQDDDFSLVIKAMQLCFKDAGTDRPKAGTVECPKCKGTLRYVIRGPRAYYGKCDTIDCLDWMG